MFKKNWMSCTVILDGCGMVFRSKYFDSIAKSYGGNGFLPLGEVFGNQNGGDNT